MTRAIASSIAAIGVLTACAVEDDVQRPQVAEMVGIPAAPGETPRGIYIPVPGTELREAPDRLPAPRRRVIYMNRAGGTFTPGGNDSANNRSTIPSGTSFVPAWSAPEAGWQQVMTCMRELWAPFDVEITDVEPEPSVDYIESVVAGRPQNVGMGSGVGGVSPFECGVIERSIVFTFAEVYGNDYRAICETAAQEVAHSFGLDHEFLCEDPMTYLFDCGEKSFQDIDAPCGEYSARSCNCGGSTQNSVRILTELNGPSDLAAPMVSIVRPANGAQVAPAFDVVAEASDDRGVERVELWIDGALSDTLLAPPYAFATPILPPGVHTVETIAYDSKNDGRDGIEVTVADPNADPGDDEPPGGSDSDPDGDGVDDGAGGGAPVVTGGCRTSGSASWLGTLLVLALLGRRRRA